MPQSQGAREQELVQACYLALAAILGTLLRITIAQLFGEECNNPGTIGWLSAAAPLCVTGDGDASQEGGIIFADLPSNILGSFLMGFFQSAAVLGITVPMAVAWLSPHHPFQKMSILHKAFTTGFCGSLTTFSSWNTNMVVMIFGTGNNRETLAWSAALGYIIGMVRQKVLVSCFMV
jgi:fluoride ion exporter CrcB/FEX